MHVVLLQIKQHFVAPKVLQKSNILEVAQKGPFCYTMFVE